MRGINPEKIPDFIRGDVELVKKEARFVLIVSENETTITVSENDNPRLDVFAVIGPSEGFGRHWDEVLLAEIGIARTRPYCEVKGLCRKPGQKNLHQRRKWFFLSERQYQVVSPIIFKLMGVRAEKTVSGWKSGSSENRFIIRTYRSSWSNRKKKLSFTKYKYACPTGIRFHVSLQDEFFIRDIFWAELNLNENIQKVIGGLARFISKRLNWYGGARYKGKKPVVKLIGYQQVKERIEEHYFTREIPHLMIELVKKLKEDSRLKFFFPYLADIFQWYGEDTEESRLASLAPNTPYLKERLGNIQILVTTDLSKKRRFITFEVQK